MEVPGKIIPTPRGPVILRPGQETDAAAYRELRLEALRTHPTAFSADLALNESHPLEYWVGRLRDTGTNAMMYFAVHNDTFIGMTGIVRDSSAKTRHSGLIISVYVNAAWRGMHIAESLIEQCAVWARSQGMTVLKLGVNTDNTSAIRCYARCGFTVYGTAPQAIYHDGVMYDELLMAKVL